MTLQTFLDFAIGAATCIEMLHGQDIVHGEVRGDAFHMNKDTGRIRLLTVGAGLQAFEPGLSSAGWSKMSKAAWCEDEDVLYESGANWADAS
jgi:hypothetical protein